MVKLPELRKYQKEAIEAWLKHKRGIIQLPTGSGKTVVALSIWRELNYPKTLYIAPTRALIKDLAYKFQMKYGIPAKYISENPRKPKLITFATYMMIGSYHPHIAEDFDFYILDEAHHAAAENFYLNALPILLKDNKPILGLTASPKTSSEYSEKFLRKVPVIYSKTFREEGMKQYRPKTILYLNGVEFSHAERRLYEELEETLQEVRKKSGNKIRSVVDASRLLGRNDALSKLAGVYLKTYNQRKKLTQRAPAKITAVLNIIKKHANEERIMLFAETIDELIKVTDKLNEIGIPAIALTSRTVSSKDIEVINEQFGKKYKVLGLVKMGEEGIDFPDLNVLIIMGSPKSERAIIQRVGRVLRFKEGKVAHIYFVFVKNTFEEGIAKQYISKIKPDEIQYINTEVLEGVEEEVTPLPTNNIVQSSIIKTLDKLLSMYSKAINELEGKINYYEKTYTPMQLFLLTPYNKAKSNYKYAVRKYRLIELIRMFLLDEVKYEEFNSQLKSLGYTVSKLLLDVTIPNTIKEELGKKLNR